MGYANRMANGGTSDATADTTSTPARPPDTVDTQYTFDPFAAASDTNRNWGYDPFAPDSGQA